MADGMNLVGGFMDPLVQGAQIQQTEAQTRELGSLAQLHGIQAQQAQMQMQDHKALQQMAQGLPPGGSPEDRLQSLGDFAARRGMLDQAEKAYNLVGLSQQRQARALEMQTLAEEKQAKMATDRINKFASMATIYPDSQAGWEMMKRDYASQHQLSPYEQQLFGVPWRPGLASQIAMSLAPVKDQLAAKIQAGKLKLEEFKTNAQVKHWANLDGLGERRQETADKREARLAKVGATGKAPGSPTQGTSEAALAYVQNRAESEDAPANIAALAGNGEAAKQFADVVASSAQVYMKGGLSREDAFDQAFEDNADRLQVKPGGFLRGDKVNVKRGGSPATKPAPTKPAAKPIAPIGQNPAAMKVRDQLQAGKINRAQAEAQLRALGYE